MFVLGLRYMAVYTTNRHWIPSRTSWLHPTCSTPVSATYLLIWLSQISFGLPSEKRASTFSRYNEMPVLVEQREHPKTAYVKIRGWQWFFMERDEIRLRYIMYNFTQKDDKSKCVLFFSREQWNIFLFISIEFGFHKGKLNISLFMELENCNQRIWSQSWDYLSYMEDTVVTNGRWLLKISWRIPPAAELVFVPPLRKLAEFLGRCPEWIQCQRSNIGNSVKIPFSDEAPHTRLQRIIVEKK